MEKLDNVTLLIGLIVCEIYLHFTIKFNFRINKFKHIIKKGKPLSFQGFAPDPVTLGKGIAFHKSSRACLWLPRHDAIHPKFQRDEHLSLIFLQMKVILTK